MKINLKNTVLASSLVAAALNLWQFNSSNAQRQAAMSRTFVFTGSPEPTGTVAARATVSVAQTNAPATAAQAAPSAAPAPTATDSVAASLARNGLNPAFAALYLDVQAKTGTPWQMLAAVHLTETHQSGSTARRSYAGATGPMQFMPATFAHYALDGDGNGTKDISNVSDAMMTAGRYLAAGGADKHKYSTALYNYNHSWSYVNKVTITMRRLGLS